jgi:hypothetical protein
VLVAATRHGRAQMLRCPLLLPELVRITGLPPAAIARRVVDAAFGDLCLGRRLAEIRVSRCSGGCTEARLAS